MKFPRRSVAYLAANPVVSLGAWVHSSYPTRPVRLVAAVVAVAAFAAVPAFPQSPGIILERKRQLIRWPSRVRFFQ